jgi:hypothetical protein
LCPWFGSQQLLNVFSATVANMQAKIESLNTTNALVSHHIKLGLRNRVSAKIS